MNDDVVRCDYCRAPGEKFCRDQVACNFRCRRRLGMPLHACLEFRARDLEREAEISRRRAEVVAAMPRTVHDVAYLAHINSVQWRNFADEQRLGARYRCEWPTCREVAFALDVHHVSYQRLGNERPEDVLVVCPICHLDLDDMRRQGRIPNITVRVVDGRRTVEMHGWIQRPRRERKKR